MTLESVATSQQRYLDTGDSAHLHAAIAQGRADLAECDVDGPVWLAHQSLLSNALRMRFEHLGHDRDIDEAIEAGRRCVDRTPSGHRFGPQRLSNLGYALRLRYERLGRPADIEQAVEHGEHAVAAADDKDPDLPMMISNVAVALRVRYEVSGDLADLTRAVEAGARCLRDTAPDAYERRGMLTNLGLAHLERFEATRERADLAKGGALLRQALDITPHDDPDWPIYALNLSVVMRTAATELNSSAALDQSIELAEQAQRSLPAEHRERAGTLSELGRAHRIRGKRNDDPDERRLAVSCRREAAGDLTASPTTRALAATAWADWSRTDGDLPEAVAGFSTAIELLALVAWHGLEAETQERHLSLWRRLASAASATCVEAGEEAKAVELLERGRTVRWNQLLDQRADYNALRTAHPRLAVRLDRIRTTLDADRVREARARRSLEA